MVFQDDHQIIQINTKCQCFFIRLKMFSFKTLFQIEQKINTKNDFSIISIELTIELFDIQELTI